MTYWLTNSLAAVAALSQKLCNCSHSLIAKIRKGETNAGPETIKKIASIPRVNNEWLINGVGDPLYTGLNQVGYQVPISEFLLSGHPSENLEILSGRFVEVAPSFYRETLYAIEAKNCGKELSRKAERLFENDLLIIETNKGVWDKNLSRLNNSLCVVERQFDGWQHFSVQRPSVSGTAGNLKITATTPVKFPKKKTDKVRREHRVIQLDVPRDNDGDSSMPIKSGDLKEVIQVAGLVVLHLRQTRNPEQNEA